MAVKKFKEFHRLMILLIGLFLIRHPVKSFEVRQTCKIPVILFEFSSYFSFQDLESTTYSQIYDHRFSRIVFEVDCINQGDDDATIKREIFVSDEILVESFHSQIIPKDVTRKS